MDFISLDPTDENLHSLISSVSRFPFKYVGINNPGDYENEYIEFEVTEDNIFLSSYILMYSVENTETGIPDYATSRFLTFDDIELQKGSLLQIYTKPGEDSTSIEFKTSAIKAIIHWGLDKPIWSTLHASIELMRRNDSYSISPRYTEY